MATEPWSDSIFGHGPHEGLAGKQIRSKTKTVSLPALNCAGGRIGALCHASTNHATGHGAGSESPSKAGAICGGTIGMSTWRRRRVPSMCQFID